jgi:hypothetical protein
MADTRLSPPTTKLSIISVWAYRMTVSAEQFFSWVRQRTTQPKRSEELTAADERLAYALAMGYSLEQYYSNPDSPSARAMHARLDDVFPH